MKLNTIQLLFLLLALFVTSSLALPIASVDDDATLLLAKELTTSATDSADLAARITVHDSHWQPLRIPAHIRPWTKQEIEAQEIEASLDTGNATATTTEYDQADTAATELDNRDPTWSGSVVSKIEKRSWLSHMLKGTQKCLQCGACKVGWDYSTACKDDCSYCKDEHDD